MGVPRYLRGHHFGVERSACEIFVGIVTCKMTARNPQADA